MDLKEYFLSLDLNEIDRYIQDGQEENISVEFKLANHPNYNDSNREFDKINFSTCLSGFANSSGGLIIWGIKARRNADGQDVAIEKCPIAQLTKFLNLLNRIEGQAVSPTISGIEHRKIESGDDEGYIITYVPPSVQAPHMALFAGKHYYKRNGDSFYQCEHFDIVDMFSRKKSPILKIKTKILARKNTYFESYRYSVLISIINEGKSIAKHPFLAITSERFAPDEFGLDGNRNCGLKRVRANVLYDHNYSGGSEIVIYPEAVLDVDIFICDESKSSFPPPFKATYLLSAENMENEKGNILVTPDDFKNA